ncbi:MAG: Flp pilus assembly protein CpaB [Thermogutta sp.]
MRTKSVILLLLALGCGLVAAIGVKEVLATRDRSVPAPAVEMQAIVVAAEDIPMGDPIKIEQIKLEDWPKSKIPEGALFKVEDVEDRRTKTKIYKGSPILDDQLLAKGAVDAGAAPWIPKGYRVVSVKVDAVSGSASMLRPSDRVDVVVHFAANPSKGIPKNYTRTILQNVKVFAVDDKYILTEDEKTKKSLPAKTISLLVTPEQAEILTAASELGQIRLVMRGLGDNDPINTQGVDPMELLGQPIKGGDPEQELLPGEGRPSQMDEFASFLVSQRQEGGAVRQVRTGGGENREVWVMRLLLGSQINDLTLERQSDSQDRDVGIAWRVISWDEKNSDNSNPQFSQVDTPIPQVPSGEIPPPRGSDQ